MALREAAPQTTTYYDVGGWMSYVLDGALLNVTLFPDTIAVQPDPLLDVKYFWEERVFADDPFTPAIELSVPFALAVMIFNEGYGLARDLKIESGQPEIIDNDKVRVLRMRIQILWPVPRLCVGVRLRLVVALHFHAESSSIRESQSQNHSQKRRMFSPMSLTYSEFDWEFDFLTLTSTSRAALTTKDLLDF